MRRPDVDYVSVKISALCANLDVLAFEHEVARIASRLETVYEVAASSQPPVFVNLDMEEYRDLHLTVAAFRRVLDQPRFADLPAGIVVQAYLPDTHDVIDELLAWVAERHRAGGAPVKVRLVKGANLAMEQVDAELGGWIPAPYATKAEVDASFKALLARLLDAAADGGLLVGVGSHNLFDVAWALGERDRRGLERTVGIEMLEGMAPPQSRGDAGRRRRAAPLHTGGHRRGLRRQHRLPRPAGSTRTPPRRTSCGRCSRSRRARRRGTPNDSASRTPSPPRRPCRGSRGARRTGATNDAASTPTRRSPTSRTRTSPRLPTAPGSVSTCTPTAPPSCHR